MWTVKADYDKIRVAMMYSGGKERLWGCYRAQTGDHPLAGYAGSKIDVAGFAKDIEGFEEEVKKITSAEILDPKVLLQETLEFWRGDRKGLKKVVSTCFHENDWLRVEKLLGDSWMDLTAGEIFGEKCPVSKDGTGFKIGIRPAKKIVMANDLGHMTSEGFIISHRASWAMSREDRIMKSIVENHPKFVENSHVLPELEYPAFMSGGDVTAPSDDTMAVGVRSNTNREAAIEVSKALPEKTVYAVLKYPEELGGGWVRHYGEHLNFMFSMLDEGKALVAPYVFDYPEGSKKTLMSMLKALSDDIYRWDPVRLESYMRPERWAKIPEKLRPKVMAKEYGSFLKERVDAFKDVGKVEIFKNGKSIDKKDSFLQALIDDGVLDPDGIIYVGGDPEDVDYRNEFQYFVTAIREGTHACSVATIKPGTVIAYHHMLKTNEALEDAGINVVKLDGRYAELLTDAGFGNLLLSLWRK